MQNTLRLSAIRVKAECDWFTARLKKALDADGITGTEKALPPVSSRAREDIRNPAAQTWRQRR